MPAQLVAGVVKPLVSQKKQPAGHGVLEGGRNSLLESAQEATLMSVPTWAMEGQSNCLVTGGPSPPSPTQIHVDLINKVREESKGGKVSESTTGNKERESATGNARAMALGSAAWEPAARTGPRFCYLGIVDPEIRNPESGS